MKTCLECELEFELFNTNKLYCSRKCMRRGVNRRYRDHPVIREIIKKSDLGRLKIRNCIFCGIGFFKTNSWLCSDECRRLRNSQTTSSFSSRHSNLYRSLRNERIPEYDLIWNLNFYTQIVLDNECHYCGGPLPKKGHGLDRLDSSIGHVCYNVVPCCGSCNGLKGHVISYEEMMILRPGLFEIRRRREQNPTGINYQQVGRPPVKRRTF
jgi:hypothetical protein